MSLIYSPGPCAYTPSSSSSFGQAPSYSMGSKTRNHDNNHSSSLGPGSYSPSFSPSSPRYSMGQRPQSTIIDNNDENQSPSPCSYSPLSSFGRDGPMISLKSKISPSSSSTTTTDVNVGPGTYNPCSPPNKRTSPSITMGGRLMTPLSPQVNTPSPDHYYSPSLSSSFHSTKGVSIKGRQSDPPVSHHVGPSSYNIQTSIGKGGPSYSLTGRPSPKTKKSKELNNDDSPGIGSYNLPSSIGKATAVSIHHKLPLLSSNEKNKNIGPGTYSIDRRHSIGCGETPSFSFGQRTKLMNEHESPTHSTSTTPSPSQYSIPSSFGRDSVSVSLHGKIPAPSFTSTDTNVSSASYSPIQQNLKTSPSYSMGRKGTNLNGYPSGSQSSRLSNDHVGPGRYEIKSSFGQSTPISIKGKITVKDYKNVPGVGSYTIPSPSSGPSASIKGRLGTSLYASTSNPIPFIDRSPRQQLFVVSKA